MGNLTTSRAKRSNLLANNKMAVRAEEAVVIHRAVEVIGDESQAMRWLGTPVRALDYATPVSLLHRTEGREAVLTVLGRLEHGIL